MRVFNNPPPESSLDTTLASCFLSLRHSTESRSERLPYGKQMLASEKVL